MLSFSSLALALPPWSWDTVQTYVHCANYTGEWNDDALAIMATQVSDRRVPLSALLLASFLSANSHTPPPPRSAPVLRRV